MSNNLYEFDPTANSPNNLVVDESQVLNTDSGLYLILKGGLFYTDSVIIQRTISNTPLTKGVDYFFKGLDAELTANTGFETAAVISFNNFSYSGSYTVTYQAVGGDQGNINSFLLELKNIIANLEVKPVTWDDVLNKLSTYPPESHTHNLATDLTGLRPLEVAVNRIFSALANNRIPQISGEALSTRLDRLLLLISTLRNDFNKFTAVVGQLGLTSNNGVTLQTIQDYITTSVNTAVTNATYVSQLTLNSILNNYVLKSAQPPGIITSVSSDFIVSNGILSLAVSPEIVSFTSSISKVEIGSIVNSFKLSWLLKNPVTTLTLDNHVGNVPPTSVSYVVSNAGITANTIYTLTAATATDTFTAQTSITFHPRVFWGANAAPSLTSAQVIGLQNSALADDYNCLAVYDCTGGKYPYFAYPASFGDLALVRVSTPAGLLDYSDYNVTHLTIENQYGVATLYNIVRFNNLETGSNISILWGGSSITFGNAIVSNQPNIFWGVSQNTYLTPDTAVNLVNSTYSTSLNQVTTFNCTGGQYPYYVYPSTFGAPTSVTVNTSGGPMAFSGFSISHLLITDSTGGTTLYNVVKFNNLETGSNITVTWD